MVSEHGPDACLGMEDLMLNYKRTSFTIKVDSAEATLFYLPWKHLTDLFTYVSMQEKVMEMAQQREIMFK